MSFVSAPLLVAGTPGWMLTTLTEPIRPLVSRLAQPVVAIAIFNAVLVLSHWPALVGLYLRVDAVHFGMHALWMIAGYVFWLPVLNRAPDHYGKLSPPLQMVYLFLSSIIPTVPGSFLTWAETGLFEEYALAPRLWGVTAVQDTQAAGAIMKRRVSGESPVTVAVAEPGPPEGSGGVGGAPGIVAGVFLAVIVVAALTGLVRSILRQRSGPPPDRKRRKP